MAYSAGAAGGAGGISTASVMAGANPMMAAMQVAQGVMSAVSSYGQSKQLRYNARVAEANIYNDIDTMIANRKANASREVNIGTRRLAQIENSYAKSGVEMSGSVIDYIVDIAAVQERDVQQQNQDMFYRSEVMKVKAANMRIAAKNQERALKVQAVASLFGGASKGATTQQENVAYWEKYG